MLRVGRNGSAGPWPPRARRGTQLQRRGAHWSRLGPTRAVASGGGRAALPCSSEHAAECAGGADAGHGVTLARAPVAGGVGSGQAEEGP